MKGGKFMTIRSKRWNSSKSEFIAAEYETNDGYTGASKITKEMDMRREMR
jgi:hypothetical protein